MRFRMNLTMRDCMESDLRLQLYNAWIKGNGLDYIRESILLREMTAVFFITVSAG